jgi:arsenate reductase
VATAGLVVLIFALARSRRAAAAPAAVGAYIGAAYWFTSSTSFANPAVTIGRAFTDTFTGIAPTSVPGFLAAQLVGGVLAVGLLVVLYPRVGQAADEVAIPHHIRSADTAHPGLGSVTSAAAGPTAPPARRKT